MASITIVDADIIRIAKNLGISRSKLASELGYSWDVASVTCTDAGTKHLHLVIANMYGLLTIDYGDGTVIKAAASSAGALTPADHLYAASGAKTVRVTGLGKSKTGSVTLA